jgi:arylsulfatase A-like enzyme
MKAPERTHRKLTGLAFLWSLLLASMGNVRAASSAPPSVLWIMLDDGRADTLSCYGRSWADTPHMDRIAREGVRFETAIVQNPVCVPSRTSMKSGLYAHQTGVMAMGKPASTPGPP